MRALTIWQPWAWLIAEGHKRIENRTWPVPSYLIGERVAIHAGATYSDIGSDTWSWLRQRGIEVPPRMALSYKAVVATVRIVDCVTESDDPLFAGTFGFVMDERRKLTAPVPCRGHQGFWTLPDAALAEVRRHGGVP